MDMRKYEVWFLIITTSIWGQRVAKRPKAPAHFSFLVPEREILVKIKTSIETVQYSILINFDEQNWSVMAEEMNSIFKHFEELPFFQADDAFRITTMSLLGPGFQSQKEAESNINDIIKYKDEQMEYIETVPCNRELMVLDSAELKRGILNLRTKFTKIDRNWNVEDVKSDPIKIGAIFSFITTYNVVFGEIAHFSAEILSSLELMSDNEIPQEAMRTNKTCESSNIVKETEGEIYEILNCYGSKKGYHCTTIINQPMQLARFMKMHAVNYKGFEIMGQSPSWIFLKNMETETLTYANCREQHTAHPTCLTHEIEAKCKQALVAERITETIEHCTFGRTDDPPSYVQLTEGGVLIQRANSVGSGQTAVTIVPPYIIYSPGPLTVTQDGEETVIIPAKTIESLTTVESSLTDEEVNALIWAHDGENYIESLGTEDYVNIALALVQLVLVPATIFWLWRMKQQKSMLGSLVTAVHGPDKRTIYKRNLSKVKTNVRT
jgi:hypothetical protein